MSSTESLPTRQMNETQPLAGATESSIEASTSQEHKLRRHWQFLMRPKDVRRKGQSTSHDWQKELVKIGYSIKSVEEFWLAMNDIFKKATDGNVFMFRDGVMPMWEDEVFTNGGELHRPTVPAPL